MIISRCPKRSPRFTARVCNGLVPPNLKFCLTTLLIGTTLLTGSEEKRIVISDVEVERIISCSFEEEALSEAKMVFRNDAEAAADVFNVELNVKLANNINEQMGFDTRIQLVTNDGEETPMQPVDFKSGKIDSNTCEFDGRELVCNLGDLPAFTRKEVRLYFVPMEIGVLGMEVTVNHDGDDPVLENNTQNVTFEIVRAGTELVYPWISNNEGQFESLLVATNPSGQEAHITFTAYRNQGPPETTSRTLPARGVLKELASSLFPELGSGSGYTVVLQSQTPNITGVWVTNNLVTGTGRSPSQGVAVSVPAPYQPFTQRTGSRILFDYLPVTGNLISAPVVVNIGSEPADVVLQFFNQSGQLVGEDRESLRALEPFRPFAAVANNLVGAGSGDVYMTATTEHGTLTGVAFVFNDVGEPAMGNVRGVPRW